jgi:hypothetical protein
LENGDMMVHLAFPQTTSIPATGMPSGLQWTAWHNISGVDMFRASAVLLAMTNMWSSLSSQAVPTFSKLFCLPKLDYAWHHLTELEICLDS